MPSRSVYVLIAVVVALIASGCTSSGESTEPPIFGTQDTVCVSVRYYGTASAHLAGDSIDCLMDQVEAGQPVTVDVLATTADGPIFRRYSFDGQTTLYVQDSRGDSKVSVSGLPPVFANRCRTLQRTANFPSISDCEAVEHPGFPEALAAAG